MNSLLPKEKHDVWYDHINTNVINSIKTLKLNILGENIAQLNDLHIDFISFGYSLYKLINYMIKER